MNIDEPETKISMSSGMDNIILFAASDPISNEAKSPYSEFSNSFIHLPTTTDTFAPRAGKMGNHASQSSPITTHGTLALKSGIQPIAAIGRPETLSCPSSALSRSRSDLSSAAT
jgi:hypothetical protein